MATFLSPIYGNPITPLSMPTHLLSKRFQFTIDLWSENSFTGLFEHLPNMNVNECRNLARDPIASSVRLNSDESGLVCGLYEEFDCNGNRMYFMGEILALTLQGFDNRAMSVKCELF
ncbi:hypothetical protein EJ08DRAFT_657724 [Tothia fuscella]|uniref:Uncharacterized protein n=1 Tax=Tothia fuscella TaxID=1048955 RepID=A0A9P4NX67_9PEZI|nr:hypothetical protein EJ08DRAFT_657724 [Tothia fuscella]